MNCENLRHEKKDWGFRDNIGSFRVCIWVLPASTYYQAKQPQNKSSYPRKCKNAPKSTRK